MSNSSYKMNENRLASGRKQGYTRRKVESVKDELYNSTVMYLGLISDAMDLTTALHSLM